METRDNNGTKRCIESNTIERICRARHRSDGAANWFEDLLSNAYHQYYCMEDYSKADEYVYEMRAIRKFRADLVAAHAPNSKLYDDAEMMTDMPDFVQHDDGHWYPSYIDEI